MSLKYTCPSCGTPLGYEGLCWKCTVSYTHLVLCDYLRLLEHWKTAYAPQPQDAIWHPLFVEALQRISYRCV